MTVEELYKDVYGREPERVEPITGSGSSRSYWRLSSPGVSDVIGCEGTVKAENEAFCYLTRHFSEQGLAVPHLIAVAPDCECYLMEDLGDLSLYDSMAEDRTEGTFSQPSIELLAKTMQALADVQHRGAQGLDFSICYPVKAMDRRSVLWDLNYFKYCFVKPCGIEPDEVALESDFEALVADILKGNDQWREHTFMYRDFQTRNVMVRDGKPYFIDYQGGRRGPVEYDVASMLWQARAHFTPVLREQMIDAYLTRARQYNNYDAADFRRRVWLMVLFRTVQVLGAYGFRGLIERKAKFVDSIPAALATVRELIARGIVNSYPELSRILDAIIALPRFADEPAADDLTVKVMSFSYKKGGYPDDFSGNGGGYVFDCRGLHNPGRYDQYKHLTGRDESVIRFLEEQSDITTWLEHVYAIVGDSVEVYKRRGFKHLMVCFGCTGGRHRSVYSAEHTARYINERYGVRVELIHREQGIKEILRAHPANKC